MNITWRITTPIEHKTVSASLNADTANTPTQATFEGPDKEITELKRELSRQSGAFGHAIILDSVTPIDLDAALRKIGLYGIEIIEGQELLADGYDPKIPEGAIT